MELSFPALELARDWLAWLESTRGRSGGTIRMYRRIITAYVREVVGDRPLESISPEAIEQWLQRARNGRARGLTASPATQHRDASCVRGFYSWAHARGHITLDPTRLIHTPTVHNRQPRPIADDVWLAVWRNAVTRADRVALGLLFFGGLRREELTRLRCRDVDLGRMRLVNFTRKGGGEDTLPLGTMVGVFTKRLPHLLADELWPDVHDTVLERDGNDFLIGWADLGKPRKRKPGSAFELGQLDPQNVNHWLDRMAGAQQIHVSPHMLRHSCATNLLRAGVPLPIVSNLLNHANVHTTMRYLKAGSDELGEWLAHS